MSSPVVHDDDMQRARRELQLLIERRGVSYRHVLKQGRANDVDDKGNTALCLACSFGYLDLVNALLANGANPNLKPSSGDPPLLCATRHLTVVNALLDGGANLNLTGICDGTALMRASLYGHLDVFNVLINKGADVHVVNCRGETALTLASGCGGYHSSLIHDEMELARARRR